MNTLNDKLYGSRYSSFDASEECLEAIAKELDKFPGSARHYLMGFKDTNGNLGEELSRLDLEVRGLIDRIRAWKRYEKE